MPFPSLFSSFADYFHCFCLNIYKDTPKIYCPLSVNEVFAIFLTLTKNLD